MEWEKFRQEIVGLQHWLQRFETRFLDRNEFKRFADNLYHNIKDWKSICITGYFSETIRKELESVIRFSDSVRIICPEFPISSKRDRRNLEALIKLSKAGANIKVNNRLHARFLIAYNIVQSEIWGFLIIGSFDFNTECLGLERYDAGIKTKNPDLIKAALDLFNQIWDETESKPLSEKYKKEIEKI